MVLRITLAALLSAALGGEARAQPAAERTAAARSLFDEGMRAVDARDYETATDRLRRSLELHPSPVARYNLALALVELGRLVEASEELNRVTREASAGSEPHVLAEEQLALVRPRLGRLRIDAPGASEVRVGSRVLERALVGVEQPADPGTHRVEARGPGGVVARDVTVVSGEVASVVLEVPQGGGDSTGFVVSAIAGVLAVLAAGGAIAMGLVATETYAGLEQRCLAGGCSDEELAASSLSTEVLATNVLVGVACGAAAIAAVALVVQLASGGGAPARVAAGPGGLSLRLAL